VSGEQAVGRVKKERKDRVEEKEGIEITYVGWRKTKQVKLKA
jgi:hypothetical protein